MDNLTGNDINEITNLHKRLHSSKKSRIRRKRIPVTGGEKVVTQIETTPKVDHADKATKAKRKAKRKKIFKKIGKGLLHISTGGAILATLLPLKIVMSRMLKKRGIATKKMKLKTLAVTFHNEFISKKNKPTSHYDEINVSDFENNDLFKAPLGTVEQDHIIASEVANLVGVVVKFVRDAIKKKKAAKAANVDPKTVMTEEEHDVATGGEQVVAKLDEKAEAEAPITKGGSQKFIVIGIGVAALIAVIFLIRKK
jgi:hypothetical protein